MPDLLFSKNPAVSIPRDCNLDKNIFVEDTQDCELFLSHVNYYRFSAYYLPFLDRATEKCFDGTTFERVKQIYYFDQQLRVLILSIIEDIEIHLRTELANYHSHKYGPDDYMSPEHCNPKHDHAAFLKHVRSCIKENESTLVVQHHREKYNGRFPLWVIIEFFSIGMKSVFPCDTSCDTFPGNMHFYPLI